MYKLDGWKTFPYTYEINPGQATIVAQASAAACCKSENQRLKKPTWIRLLVWYTKWTEDSVLRRIETTAWKGLSVSSAGAKSEPG